MRLLRSKKKLAVLGVFVLGAAVGAGVAVAVVTNPMPTVDTNVVREKIVFSQFTPDAVQPEFKSGWHTHPGPVIIQVQSGALRLTSSATCQTVVVGPGQTIIEAPEVPIIATANQPTKWTATLILPNSTPGAPDRNPPTGSLPNPC